MSIPRYPANHRYLLLGPVALWAGLIGGCGDPMPLEDIAGVQVFASQDAIMADDPAYTDTLQVHWLGTACYYIQLGDAAILTDPFFTHYDMMSMLLGTIESDRELVHSKISPLAPAQAIFLGHAHYDHMLGVVPTLDQPGWEQVPVYGSDTVKHVLCGYGADYEDNWRGVVADDEWHEVPLSDKTTASLEYKAILSEHAPQLPGVNLWPGNLYECLDSPPTMASDFPKGENYAYVFRLTIADAVFTIYMAASATTAPVGFPDDSVQNVDLAILGVAGWTNVEGYPGAFIERLNPTYILPAHYDDFFDTPSEDTLVLSLADLSGFLDVVRASTDVERCRVIHVDALVTFPSAGTRSAL